MQLTNSLTFKNKFDPFHIEKLHGSEMVKNVKLNNFYMHGSNQLKFLLHVHLQIWYQCNGLKAKEM